MAVIIGVFRVRNPFWDYVSDELKEEHEKHYINTKGCPLCEVAEAINSIALKYEIYSKD